MDADAERVRRRIRFLHSDDPPPLMTMQDCADFLEALLHNMCDVVEEHGRLVVVETRQLVARLDGLRIIIHPNDHQPPHFHLEAPGLDAKFRIDDCHLISGQVSTRDLRKIKYWHERSKPMLEQAWSNTRPTELESFVEPRV